MEPNQGRLGADTDGHVHGEARGWSSYWQEARLKCSDLHGCEHKSPRAGCYGRLEMEL